MARKTWRVVRIVSGILSLGCFGAAYFFHSRVDPCLAFEREYTKGSENCGNEKVVVPFLALLAYNLAIIVMTGCKVAEDWCVRSIDSGGGLRKFTCRLGKECIQTIGLILCSVGAAELSARIVLKDVLLAKYELLSSLCGMISVLLLMLAVRTPEHYRAYDMIKPTFMSILLALGKSNLLGLAYAAALCFSYRVVIFVFIEVASCFGRNVSNIPRLMVTARACVNQSRKHLLDLEANLEGVGNGQRQAIMEEVRNLEGQLNDLENAIPIRGRRV